MLDPVSVTMNGIVWNAYVFFSIIAKIIFFTYSRCPLTPSYCIESLRSKLSSRRSPIGIIGYSVGLEHLTDGGLHIHVLIKLDKKIDLRDGRFFDIVDGDGETVYHPSVEECKNFNAARDYIRKEYKENLDAGHQSGDLLECWPEDVADDGRQKRKAAFDEEEFKEFVKKARSKTEFIDIMLQERNPLALAQNFNNIIMFASYVFPAAVRETYQPGDWFNGFVNDDWLVRLTKECKSRIEAVSRGESVRKMGIRQMMKELVHFFGDSVLKSRTHSQPGSTNIFTGVTADWNVARSLYSIADIQSCIDKVRPVRFGEHLNLYELEVTAYSSGYCLGSANWMIDCGGEKISIVSSSSTVQNIHPLPFDETVLNNADVIILSDLRDKDGARFETILIEIGNCVANTLKNKGNVLFPCTMNGIIFDIIGFLSQHLRAVGLRGIPFYAVSPIAEESLKYSNICGEWMCTERQQKMYLPDNPMHHQDMIEQSLLYYASRADSSLQEKYQEPCVVFAGHPSLRRSAAINFIRKWGNNSNNSIIFTESEYDCEEAMSAFEDIVNISINSQFVRTVMTENLASNIELVNLGKDSLIASLNGTLNIHNTITSLTSAENQLNQQRYVCGEFDVSKLINELTEQIYGCRIDEFEEDKRNSSYKISLISPKATIYLNNENF
ncbi:uncharacterized protein OCT59_014808 [Rhizophagus irregularis]|nr:hypothetical protein OCT59_014808 [Rhizophagus irregularis]